MRFFVCLLDPEGRGIPDTMRRSYESLPRALGLRFQWQSVGRAAVLTAWDDPYGDPLVAIHGDWVAVGTVRLDNRADLERWSRCSGQTLSDLELVLRTVARHGTKHIHQFLGDFGFVVSNDATRTVVAACDAFAVKKLYYGDRAGLFAFGSRAEAFAVDDRYEVQYLAELVAACIPSPGLSPYAGVKSVPGGTIVLLERGRLTTRRYWSAYDFEPEPAWAKSERKAAETCRQLLGESVRLRLSGNGETWAQLSGGLDSSSVVSVAQWLADHGRVADGLGGTVTYVDSHGTGADEREYSDAVVREWQVRNQTIIDAPVWQDDEYSPPHLDEPSGSLMFYPRDRRLSAIVRCAGGRVLLTGVGGDNLFSGNMLFFSDWLARGRVWPALREMAQRAAMGRASFWELAYRNALLPLLPVAVQQRLMRDPGRMPPWVLQATAQRYGLDVQASAPLRCAGRIGDKYHHAVAVTVAGIAGSLSYEVIEGALDVRHPFLYRPLVEFALRLPAELCARPYARKWVLREAMWGILPDAVRTRIGKGTSDGCLARSLATQRMLLEPLVREPVLADLGVVDAAKLRACFGTVPRAPDGRDKLHGALEHALSIEAWLQMRSGRWPCGGHNNAVVSVHKAHSPST